MVFKKLQLSAKLLFILFSTAQLLSMALLPADFLNAQEASSERPPVPVIPEEPRTIDPATLIPSQLTKKATVRFNRAPLAEIQEWLQNETGLPVVFDVAEMANEGRSLFDEHSDSLQDVPIYMLLNRLSALELGWYLEDEILNISTSIAIENKLHTQTYVVSDLIDAGYTEETLLETFLTATPGPWFEMKGEGGTAQLLGDVLFVNQTYANQLEVAAILSALRKHGLETFLLVPEENLVILAGLQVKGSVNFQNEPLIRVVDTIARESKLDIRLDTVELANQGISVRDSVSLSIIDRTFETILRLLLSRYSLKTVVQDGVVLITTEHAASNSHGTAFYDVRDLCRDEFEADNLQYAIQQQTNLPWRSIEGEGGDMIFPKPGIMVVRQSAEGLTRVRQLLDAYRNALRLSKPRPKTEENEAEKVVTHFYRVDSVMAEALVSKLWSLLPEGTVDVNQSEEKLGLIQSLPSQAILRQVPPKSNSKVTGSIESSIVVPQTTLIITHQKRVHWEIQKLIKRIESGDPPVNDPSQTLQGSGGMGGFSGGGGFGGGFFQIPIETGQRE